jgi:hypothetical protein
MRRKLIVAIGKPLAQPALNLRISAELNEWGRGLMVTKKLNKKEDENGK